MIHRWWTFFRVWHRRLGVAACTFIVLLAVTGVMLNHSDQLDLGHYRVTSPLILSWYGIDVPTELVGYQAGGHWFTQISDQLVMDDQWLYECTGVFSGAVLAERLLVALCGGSLLLLDPTGALVERVDSAMGLPDPLTSVGVSEGRLLVLSAGMPWRVDLNALTVQPYAGAPDWAEPALLPESLASHLLPEWGMSEMNWERLAQDVHSGRLLGMSGVWFTDFIALIMTWLACTGLWMWYRATRRVKKRRH